MDKFNSKKRRKKTKIKIMRFGIGNKLVGKFRKFNSVRLKLILIFLFGFCLVGLVCAATFSDVFTSEPDGTHSGTVWDAVDSVDLTTGGTSGDYISSVKDAGSNSSWNSIAWTPEQPYYKELPNNKGQESGYPTGNADMTENVLLMHMNEESGTIVDYSGEGNDGTTYGGVAYSANGKLNSALSFDGVDDYMEIVDTDSLDFGTDNFAIATWFKAKNKDYSQHVHILSKQDPEQSSEWVLQLLAQSGASAGNLVFRADATNQLTSAQNYFDDMWHYVVVTREGGTFYMFVDGLQKDSKTVDLTLTNSKPLRIGARFSSYWGYLDGSIDEVAIYHRSLSASEVLNYYKRGVLRLKYQVRSGATSPPTGDFVGPDGTTGTYYSELDNNSTTTPSFNLTNVFDNPYFQYRAYFETDDSSYTPELKSVTTDYTLFNSPPNQPINVSPSSGATGVGLNPDLVGSSFSDPENDTHIDTQWQVDDDEDFSSPDWTRTAGAGETNTIVNSANGTFVNELDGQIQLNSGATYYWRVRCKDDGSNSYSDWSAGTYFTTYLQQKMIVTVSGSKECKSEENIKFVTQVKNASGEVINNAVVTIDIWKPDDTALLSSGSMTYITGSDGLYSYDYISPSTEGVYVFSVKASFGGNTGYGSDIFYVAPWIGGMASDVWENDTRTLTDYATPSIADAVWDEARSEHTASGSFGEALQNIVSTALEIASSTWSYTGSALDTTGNAIGKVWSFATRKLTSREITAGENIAREENIGSNAWGYTGSVANNLIQNLGDAIWSSYTGTRKLTSRQIGENEHIAGVSSSSTVSQVADQPTQENVEYNVELVRKATFDFAGFADGGSTTTLVDSELTQPDDHWNNYELWMMSGNNIGLKRAICDFDRESHTITLCGDALSQPIEANDQYVISHERKLVHSIWNWTDKQLTSVGNIASAVWGWTQGAGRTLTSNELAGGASLATESYIDTATSTIIAEINANEAKIDNIYTDTQYVNGKVDEILTKWGAYSAADIMGDLDTVKSRIGTSTDSSSDETLFGRTKFIQEKWGTQTAQTIYDTAKDAYDTIVLARADIGYATSSTAVYDDIVLLKGYTDDLEILTGHPTDSSSANTLFGRVKGVKEETDKLIENIIVVDASVNGSNASTTQFVANLTQSTDDFYNNNVLVFTSGTNAGQVRRIIDYDGTLKKITVDPALAEAPANDNTFSILSQTAKAGIDAQTIWTYGTRVLTAPDLDSGSLATLSDLQKQWTVYLSDFREVLAGNIYRAKLWVLNYESVPTDAFATTTLTIYDAVRNKVVENVEMTKISTGIYEYTYSVPSGAVQGVWETDVSVEVEAGKIIKRNDYWEVEGSPAQVKINSITDKTVPSVSANVTISNEGSAGYEYQYEWCAVSSEDNHCGGDDDIFYSSAAKYIQAGEDWNTALNATVSNAGSYWFKMVVYYGTEKSGASQTFTAVEEERGREEVLTPRGGGGGIITLEKEKEEEKPLSALATTLDWIEKPLKRLASVEKKTTTLTSSVTRLEVKLAELDKKMVKVLKPAPPQIIKEKVVERRVLVRKPMPQVPRRRARVRLESY